MRALVAFVMVLSLQACTGPSEADLLGSAKKYMAQQDTKAAILQLKTVLQRSPQSGEARYLLGKALLDSGDATAAIVELRKAADLKYDDNVVAPPLARSMLLAGDARRLVDNYAQQKLSDNTADADLKTTLAQAYASQDRADLAEQALDAALAAAPQYAPAKMMKARLLAARQAFPAALLLLGEVTVDGVSGPAVRVHAEAWLLQAEIEHHGTRDRTAALASYRKAADTRSDLMAAHQGIVALLVESRDLDAARAHVEQIKKTQPDKPATKMLDAQLALLRKDYAATRAITQPLLQLAPNNPLLLQLAGAAEFYLRALPQAENLLAQAVRLAPNLPLARQLLAQTYLRTGQPEKTLELLRPLIESAAPGADGLMLAGEAYLQIGDAARAEALFTRAAKARPDDPRARTALALGKIGKGNAATGLAELEAVAASDAGTTADMALVASHLRRTEIDKALKALDALERKRPESPLPANLRGRILVLNKDAAGARKSFERALALDAVYYPAIASLAALDMAEKKPESARKRFEELLVADPKNHRALLALASIQARTGGSPQSVADLLVKAVGAAPSEAVPRLQLVNHHLGTGNAKAAMAAAQEGLTALPGSRELVQALGRAQLASGDFEQAVTSFNKLAGLQPRLPAAHLGLAEAHAGLKRYDVAERSLKQALDLAPNLVPAQRSLIGLMVDEDRTADALAVARQVQKQRPAEAVGFHLEGDIELRRRAWDAAIAAYRAGLQKQASTESAIKLHAGLRTASRQDEADRFSAGWLKDHPRDAAFAFYLGDAALGRNDWAQAEAQYREVLVIQPDNALALNNVAWLMVKQSKPGALAMAEKATTLLPGKAPLLDTLALALAAENQLPRAIALHKQTLLGAPEDPGLRLTLARLYLKAGDKAQAKAELQTLAKLGKRFREHADVTELLKSV